MKENTCKKLIEVAMPIKEISAESVRDKSIRHGHISTLHLWWARRPLSVCRAVVFASLVPDPLDSNCPQVFKDAVNLLLGKENNSGDLYRPYSDIPYTSSIDKMDDNLRNRLLMFIGKFSEIYCLNEKQGKKTDAKNLLTDSSLIKWDNKDNYNIINKARKLIWVSHNALKFSNINQSLIEFDKYFNKIKLAEQQLYSTQDRHLLNRESQNLTNDLKTAIDNFLERMPKVFDPFAGGGAIPLEAARLGCLSFGNDINPVAHIIQKCSLEYPQKFGKPITYSMKEFNKLYGDEQLKQVANEDIVYSKGIPIGVTVSNRLSFDVEFQIIKLLRSAESDLEYLYPKSVNDNIPIIYYWARVAHCSNPSCKSEIPLLRNFTLCNKKDKQIFLNPIISGKLISFKISHIPPESSGFVNRGNLICPVCGNTTDSDIIKKQSLERGLNSKLIAVIEETKETKQYRLPNQAEIDVIEKLPLEIESPSEQMQRNSGGGDTFGWGITQWGQLYTRRQLLVMHTFTAKIKEFENKSDYSDIEYSKAILTYLAIFLDRMATRLTAFGLWNTKAETLEHPFARQAIPMVLDYPETNPFSKSTGGGYNQLDWIIRYIESESCNEFYSICNNTSSGDVGQFQPKFIDAVVTDPPYYDAIAYADISDYFYVWLKRTLGESYPYNFSTPQTPKSDECTALKHHHNGSLADAKAHFEGKLLSIFRTIEIQTSGVISIMFAHQSTEAWTTLCNSILGANMNITGSWSIDTERTSGVKVDKAFLSSSVTVSCRPAKKNGVGEYKSIKSAIKNTVAKEVDELYKLGFRGADLLTACFGQAVSEFGKYEKVEKIDGSTVTVGELLDMAKEGAFNALLKGFDGDDFTKFYIGWLQLYGFTESDFDDAAKFSRVGLNINVADLFTEHILIRKNNIQYLAGFVERVSNKKTLGEQVNSYLIDKAHRAMFLFKEGNRKYLLKYINDIIHLSDDRFWRVITSLCEVLPEGSEDHKMALGILTNKDSLIRDSKAISGTGTEQVKLEL